MKPYILALGAITLAAPYTLAKSLPFDNTALNTAPAPLPVTSSANTAAFVALPPDPRGTAQTYRPFSALGFATRVGFAGTGFDVATPLAMRFNLRAGGDFFSYTATFQEQGANVGVDLNLRSGHTALDWFPFGGHFRLSPQLVFGNSNRILATAVIPSGSTVTLNGQDYVSSYTDPLHGSATRLRPHRLPQNLPWRQSRLR
jgi:hypothetical protein